jgi:YVTN family beta-propeller protein
MQSNNSKRRWALFRAFYNIVTATVEVGLGGVAVTPDGKFVYVANGGSNNVSVIDTAINTVTATVAVGLGPQGVAVTPDGKFVYVANKGSSTVSVIAAASNTVTATVGVEHSAEHKVAVSSDGRFVYVANFGSFSMPGVPFPGIGDRHGQQHRHSHGQGGT